jgi:3-oxoacyl-[acyl-carrier-protein] synthase-3
MFASLELDPAIDFPTVEFLGNTGSVALPVAMAMAVEQGRLAAGDQVALLGIGSGINSLMIGVEWQAVRQSKVPSPKFMAGKTADAGMRIAD